jgi:lysozyme family protein
VSNFDRAVAHVKVEEKGYVNNPDDPGGATNFGITQQLLDDVRGAYAQQGYPASVKDLTWPQAREIYRLHFWQPLHGGELPLHVSLPLLDAAVNSSVTRAAKWLQSALGVAADGWIGAKTIRAARAADPKTLLNEFHALRAYHYMMQDAIDDKFGLGWARRLFDTYSAAREVE